MLERYRSPPVNFTATQKAEGSQILSAPKINSRIQLLQGIGTACTATQG